MKKKKLNIFLYLIPIILFSCGNNTTNNYPEVGNLAIGRKNKIIFTKDICMDTTQKSKDAPCIDTTFYIKDINKSNYSGRNLTKTLACKTLYGYFSKKGYLISDNLSPNLPDSVNTTCILFNTIYIANFNHNKYQDAIIDYWLTPPFACGNSWQPHKAVIIDTDSGYTITNEEFMPDNYIIDSVTTINNKITVYGYDYDTYYHSILRYFHATIKIK